MKIQLRIGGVPIVSALVCPWCERHMENEIHMVPSSEYGAMHGNKARDCIRITYVALPGDEA